MYSREFTLSFTITLFFLFTYFHIYFLISSLSPSCIFAHLIHGHTFPGLPQLLKAYHTKQDAFITPVFLEIFLIHLASLCICQRTAIPTHLIFNMNTQYILWCVITDILCPAC